ncbi:MAG: hypothetical protein HY528_00630, partial [Chloroflexi bacterium]|nr:hypothetical protein [Chloroflexota bacterium]
MDTLIDLKRFYEKMTQYEELIENCAYNRVSSSSTNDTIQDLRTELQREYPKMEGVIARYGGNITTVDPFFGRKLNIFDVAFGPFDVSNWGGKLNAINDIKATVNKAIGKLEAEGESWGIPLKKPRTKSKKTKVFISYSGNSSA